MPDRRHLNIEVCGAHCVLLILSRHGAFEVLFDSEDRGLVEAGSWSIHDTNPRAPNSRFYVYGRVGGKQVKLHRHLLGLSDPRQVVRHLNHNTMDNRRQNLEAGSQRKNMTTGFGGKPAKGIAFRKNLSKRPWEALISIDGKQRCLGYFATEEEALARYRQVTDRLLGGETLDLSKRARDR